MRLKNYSAAVARVAEFFLSFWLILCRFFFFFYVLLVDPAYQTLLAHCVRRTHNFFPLSLFQGKNCC